MTRASLSRLSITDRALGRIHIPSAAPHRTPGCYVVITQSDSPGTNMLTRTRRANPSPKVTGPACQLPLQLLRAAADSSSCGPDAVSVRRRPPRSVLPRPAQRSASAAASLLPTPTSLQRHTAFARGDTPAAEPAPRRHPRPVAPAGAASDSQHTLPPQSASLSPVSLKTETLPQAVRIPRCKLRYLHQDPHTHALQAAPPRPFAARASSPYNHVRGLGARLSAINFRVRHIR